VSLPQGETGTLLLNKANAYLIAEVGPDALANGTNLVRAYARAKAVTPHGQSLSSTNRATVFLFPATYLLADSALALDTPYVDLIGVGNAQATRLESDGNALVQLADDVTIEHLVLHCSSRLAPTLSPQDKAAYAPADNLAKTGIRHCRFEASHGGWGMRLRITYAGLYVGCTAGPRGWGGPGNFNGRATDCGAGDYSFGAGGLCSGFATNCTAGLGSFGGSAAGGFHGVAKNCQAGHDSFGGSGTMIGCDVSGALGAAVLTTGRLSDCRIGPAPGNPPSILVGPGARLYNCTVLANPGGSGYSIEAQVSTLIRAAHCRLNHGMHNVINTIAQPSNVDDPSLE
jgi:hypothetical protein